jgi:tRNA threonylcarbamoyl adenosine modification protein (Sua5/YciO/YrdC/YwlC family)
VIPTEDRGTSAAALAAAEAALDDGAVVAVPTDTVYGLAARIDRPEGIAAVFAAKRRPADLALPVLVGEGRQIGDVAGRWPESAAILAARYWPGPLTLVVPAREGVGRLLGSGDTVGVRQPRHRFIRRLCGVVGPLAVTSANLHGSPPLTRAADVAEAFAADEVALVVDGGRCDGVPSTVVDCTGSPPRCLRVGGVPWESVEVALR